MSRCCARSRREIQAATIIHLGDVYYSGTVEECTQNVLDVMDQIFADANLAPRPPFFAIPGNHDYYAGGRGFHTIAKVNAGIAGCAQQTAISACAPRTMDGNFAMDTPATTTAFRPTSCPAIR